MGLVKEDGTVICGICNKVIDGRETFLFVDKKHVHEKCYGAVSQEEMDAHDETEIKQGFQDKLAHEKIMYLTDKMMDMDRRLKKLEKKR